MPTAAGSRRRTSALPELPTGANLTPDAIGRTLAHLLPDHAILSDEMVSSGEAVLRHLAGAPAFDLLPVTGGSIGQGLPVAVGAAVACPHRKVIALEADGSGMYTAQSLWTMAREKLDVVVVIIANRRYRILDIEMETHRRRRHRPARQRHARYPPAHSGLGEVGRRNGRRSHPRHHRRSSSSRSAPRL